MSISSSLPVQGTGHAHGAAVIGVDGHLVQASARISNGPPAVSHFRPARNQHPGRPATGSAPRS